MVQEIRSNEPQYICVVKIERITNNQDEEIMAFGVSEDDAKNQAQHLLAKNYGCNESQILELIQEARIEPIGQWCAPQEHQD
ncbi:hypothetical protein ACF3DV_19030 [Chlorogloeopsis fritschii PCC 9212]|uniref:Uncharacterized protein n=1 Tax=Chlorogloeopsis fritschii PCC 6912 TaxID=211165 RepID=A0A3S1AJE9_CHLFR|nr:hypothetical protein [Chlorogloeopsis fritschii]RUR81733.1 hypothetical protein PCC6912_26020 [Chlorogloeopsis fritschii PCC 6912]